MKHYKKDCSEVFELSPIELMCKHSKVWKQLKPSDKKTLLAHPSWIIRVTVSSGDYSIDIIT